jgi:hypothetical protein
MIDEVNRDFGKVIAAMLVFATMFVLSFQHKNSITGAAAGATYGELYGGWMFLFLTGISFVIVLAWTMRKKKIKWSV